MSDSENKRASSRDQRIYPCPRCGEPVDWNNSPRWKPFCSERCKLIDLGAWFSEEHAIPGESLPEDSNRDDSGDD